MTGYVNENTVSSENNATSSSTLIVNGSGPPFVTFRTYVLAIDSKFSFVALTVKTLSDLVRLLPFQEVGPIQGELLMRKITAETAAATSPASKKKPIFHRFMRSAPTYPIPRPIIFASRILPAFQGNVPPSRHSPLHSDERNRCGTPCSYLNRTGL